MKNRWIYKGSVTTPPCDKFVYWNVARTILPISKKHLAMFKHQLARPGTNLDVIGNYRNVQPIANHLPMIVTSALNKVNINVMDQLIVKNNYEGGVDINLSNKLHGHVAEITPLPNGLMEVFYADQLLRTVTVKSDGLCTNIDMCNW